MTDEIDFDALRAETAFVQERIADLESAHHARLKALGEALRANIAPDDFTLEVFARALTERLQRSGNEVLAKKWTATWSTLMESMQRLDELNVRNARELDNPDPAPVAAEEHEEWVSARDAANEAVEQFERVIAEGSAWLDGLGPKVNDGR